MNKKVFLRTFGCQMNERDSEIVKGLLLAEGYKLTDTPEGADVVLFNTCSVRQHAEDKVWSGIGRFKKKGRQANRLTVGPVIGILGCMAENYKEDIFKRAPLVDIVCGPAHIDNIALYLKEALKRKENVLGVGEKKRRDEIYLSRRHYHRLIRPASSIITRSGQDPDCNYSSCLQRYGNR